MQWTVDQVNAIVQGGLWPKTAIFITWDDWGSWWDHVNPPDVEKWTDGTQFRYGSRVGCLVLSPYAKAGYISLLLHSHVSLVKFCEDTFGLTTLNARDAASDGNDRLLRLHAKTAGATARESAVRAEFDAGPVGQVLLNGQPPLRWPDHARKVTRTPFAWRREASSSGK